MKLEKIRAMIEAATLRPIPGYADYFASDDGNVWSTTGWRGIEAKQLAKQIDQHGYHKVRLVVDGKRRKKTAHSLICSAFHGPKPTPTHEVRHLNGIRIDNRPNNLVWGTRSENALDRQRHGTEKCFQNGRSGWRSSASLPY